jgi:hypothetical protein
LDVLQVKESILWDDFTNLKWPFFLFQSLFVIIVIPEMFSATFQNPRSVLLFVGVRIESAGILKVLYLVPARTRTGGIAS